MPFTFAHPAIILPLTKRDKRGLSLTGLITGAIAPDFEYFIRMRIYSIYSHTVSGLFWFDVPMGTLIAFLFHNLVRNSLYDNLPSIISARLYPYKSFNWNTYFKKHWPVVLLSILIGACSHLFLDDFTHAQGYFVKIEPGFFTRHIVGSIPLFKILQHTFTSLSALYIVYYIQKMPKTDADNKPTLLYWACIALLSVIILTVRFWIIPDYRGIANVIVSGISAFMVGLIVTPMVVQRS